MNQDSIIKWTNRIAVCSIILLVYWTFIFIAITVFDFKIFRENITEFFFMSVFGILALMFGAIVVNVMYNLTKISAALCKEQLKAGPRRKTNIFVVLFLVSFPLVLALLYFGDHLSTRKKEVRIKSAALQLTEGYNPILKELGNYRFDDEWRDKAADHLKVLRAIDESFPCVNLIVKDQIGGDPVFLSFSQYFYDDNEKVNHIYTCSADERAFLIRAFDGDLTPLFSSSGNKYELYQPVEVDGKIIVFYLSDWQQYGKY